MSTFATSFFEPLSDFSLSPSLSPVLSASSSPLTTHSSLKRTSPFDDVTDSTPAAKRVKQDTTLQLAGAIQHLINSKKCKKTKSAAQQVLSAVLSTLNQLQDSDDDDDESTVSSDSRSMSISPRPISGSASPSNQTTCSPKRVRLADPVERRARRLARKAERARQATERRASRVTALQQMVAQLSQRLGEYETAEGLPREKVTVHLPSVNASPVASADELSESDVSSLLVHYPQQSPSTLLAHLRQNSVRVVRTPQADKRVVSKASTPVAETVHTPVQQATPRRRVAPVKQVEAQATPRQALFTEFAALPAPDLFTPLPLWQSADDDFVRPHSPLDFFLA